MKKIFLLFAGLTLSLGSFSFCHAQWSSNTDKPLSLFEGKSWADEMKLDAQGNSYFYCVSPEKNATCIPYIKKLDYTGKTVYGPIRLSAFPTDSYTMINSFITLDKDNNLISLVCDFRADSTDDMYSYTAYKNSPTGEVLWKDGVSLSGGKGYFLAASSSLVSLEDGSTVCAYMTAEDLAGTHAVIRFQRISADGKALWTDKTLVGVDGQKLSYPSLHKAGVNEFYLVYCSGATPEIYVQKYDFDGNAIWAQPTLVYGLGGFGNGGAMQSIMSISPAKDGLIVAWNDDRENTKTESVYINYINKDGKYVLVEGDKGTKLGHSGLRGFTPVVAYDYENNKIFAVWRETSELQGNQWIRGQLMDVATGDMLWEPEGKLITPDSYEGEVAYCSPQIGPKSTYCAFWMNQNQADTKHTFAYAALYDKAGNPVWKKEKVALLSGKYSASGLTSSPFHKNQWLVLFLDNSKNTSGVGELDDYSMFAQNVLTDGTLGPDPAVANEKDPTSLSSGLKVFPNPVSSDFNLSLGSLNRVGNLKISLCNMVGQESKVLFEGSASLASQIMSFTRPAELPRGIYFIKVTLSGKTQTIKVLFS